MASHKEEMVESIESTYWSDDDMYEGIVSKEQFLENDDQQMISEKVDKLDNGKSANIQECGPSQMDSDTVDKYDTEEYIKATVTQGSSQMYSENADKVDMEESTKSTDMQSSSQMDSENADKVDTEESTKSTDMKSSSQMDSENADKVDTEESTDSSNIQDSSQMDSQNADKVDTEESTDSTNIQGSSQMDSENADKVDTDESTDSTNIQDSNQMDSQNADKVDTEESTDSTNIQGSSQMDSDNADKVDTDESTDSTNIQDSNQMDSQNADKVDTEVSTDSTNIQGSSQMDSENADKVDTEESTDSTNIQGPSQMDSENADKVDTEESTDSTNIQGSSQMDSENADKVDTEESTDSTNIQGSSQMDSQNANKVDMEESTKSTDMQGSSQMDSEVVDKVDMEESTESTDMQDSSQIDSENADKVDTEESTKSTDMKGSSQIDSENADKVDIELSDSVDSEDCPLSKLCRKKRPVKRKLITDCSDDDSFDKSYSPKTSDFNSTDSEAEVGKKSRPDPLAEEYVRIKKKVQKKKCQRNKAWHKTPTPIAKVQKRVSLERKKFLKGNAHACKLKEKIKHQQNQRKRQSSVLNEEDDLEKAKRVSAKAYSLKFVIRKAHTIRLGHLLESNELKRVPVNADGNCFFAAFRKSAQIDIDETQLRTDICEFITDHIENYIAYSYDNSSTDSSEKFLLDIEQLKTRGNWNVNVADCLPHAAADMYKCTVRIYSSSVRSPVYDFKPHMPTVDTDRCVNLAYVAIKGEEHYEAVLELNKNEKTRQKTPEKRRGKQGTEVTEDEQQGPEKPYQARQTPDEKEKGSHQTPRVTPHKRANYQSPLKKCSSRKKSRNPEKWKRNVQKQNKLKGKAYTSHYTGKNVEAKNVKAQDCSKCRFKCNSKVTEEQRKAIHEFYYNLNSYERQRNYICDMTTIMKPCRSKKGKRSVSKQYHLVVGDKKERVCQTFFMKTLDIGKKTIEYTLKKKTLGGYPGNDMRGRSTPRNKIDQERLKFVHDHIRSFPTMESHYARKKSNKKYLAHNLNIKQMWRLYCTECSKKGIPAVRQAKYRQIFCNSYNYSFFKPKKDQCSLCEDYKRKQERGTLDPETENRYTRHQESKVRAREEKERDKERAKGDKSQYVATFDLQAVLTTPCSLVSEFYYSRKLCVYNLTIYSLADKNVVCHVWDETHGKRGSSEIATCIMKNTLSVCSSPNVKEITYFSDTCGGQNRNQFVAASYLFTMSKISTLKTINHKFLESGHSQMECDSVHSTIEQAKKKTAIYYPSGWNTVINHARKQNPYIAVPMKYEHVLDMKQFTKKHCPNLKTSTSGERVNWLLVRWIQVRANAPRSVFINYSFDEEKFLEIKVQSIITRQKGRQMEWPEELDHLYGAKLPVSELKKKDLLSLCRKGIIPEEFTSFYQSLPTDKMAKDKIPFPSDTESDTDSE